jgi:acyl-coenzyme A thioesterase PaaI-like protein
MGESGYIMGSNIESLDFSDLLAQGFEEIHATIPSGIEHFCFVCSTKNPIGLKLRFFGNKRTQLLVSRFIPQKEHCGFPIYTHGGILATLSDETMAYATFLIFGKYGVTKSFTIHYHRPVFIGKPIFIQSKITSSLQTSKGIEIQAETIIYAGLNNSGKICSTAQGTLIILPDERMWKDLTTEAP